MIHVHVHPCFMHMHMYTTTVIIMNNYYITTCKYMYILTRVEKAMVA